MRILAIETSCDETGISLVEITENKKGGPKVKVLEETVSSQIKIHAPFGGVVPSLAKREHIRNLPILLSKIGLVDSSRANSNPEKLRLGANPEKLRLGAGWQRSKVKDSWKKIDLIAVTAGPGLEPALWTGIECAKDLAKKWKKPLIGANHLHGHMYSFLLSREAVGKKVKGKSKSYRPKFKNIPATNYKLQDTFPAIVLLVSGGHTILAVMKNLYEYKKLGETRDDAVGESFDKVARLLELPYPGGPEIEKIAKNGDPKAIDFPSPMMYQKNYNFSYSGLKTAVLYYLRDHRNAKKEDVAASFQRAAFASLVVKTMRAVEEYGAKTIIVGGGVAANRKLERMLAQGVRGKGQGVRVVIPPMKYCMDNATMIAIGAYMRYQKKKKYPLRANGALNI